MKQKLDEVRTVKFDRNRKIPLMEYLKTQAGGEAKSSKGWEKSFPGCDMAAWRAGASYAYADVARKIQLGKIAA